MSTLIPEYSWTDFVKVVKLKQLHRLKSGEVTFDGEYLFSFVNGSIDTSGFLRLQTEYKCQVSNSVVGESLEQILQEVKI